MEKLEFKSSTIAYPLLFVLIIWIVFWAEVRFDLNFNFLGVKPRELFGLRGIIFSPFIHANIEHLYSNTIPLLLLSTALFYFYKKISWKVLLYGTLLTGILTWFLGRGGAVHFGASGVVYLLTSFLFFKGIWSKNFRLIALALVIVFIYGSLVWGMFPIDQTMSWEGHLSGFISGIILAFYFKNFQLPKPAYPWQKQDYSEEEDEFMKHFDEEGNFIPTSELNKFDEESSEQAFEINYTIKPSKKDQSKN
ncbi:rhomboid family intramembrane serine protease [Mesonia aquimarina]|uniref:rhomboid family intramembrane serine protease n=1 Tax=Mesonia aquimarina TaxID=1504967 RepID=UPI000EF5EB1D|nr:rhomboid family intramembrane serine protease [Mesonia aquimarina]